MSERLQDIMGRRMREIRTKRGLSQEALAEQLGWHRTYVGALERGERNVSLQVLEDLAVKLRVKPLDLLRD